MIRIWLFIVPLLIALGCATAPVQEMSDARQALHSAEEAGVKEFAPATYSDAEQLILEAERLLKKGDYGAAKERAVLAKQKLLVARDAMMNNWSLSKKTNRSLPERKR